MWPQWPIPSTGEHRSPGEDIRRTWSRPSSPILRPARPCRGSAPQRLGLTMFKRPTAHYGEAPAPVTPLSEGGAGVGREGRLGPRPGEELTLHGRAQHHYPYVIEVESDRSRRGAPELVPLIRFRHLPRRRLERPCPRKRSVLANRRAHRHRRGDERRAPVGIELRGACCHRRSRVRLAAARRSDPSLTGAEAARASRYASPGRSAIVQSSYPHADRRDNSPAMSVNRL